MAHMISHPHGIIRAAGCTIAKVESAGIYSHLIALLAKVLK